MAKNRFRPIIIPQNVKVTLSDSEIKVQGPLGNLLMQISPRVTVEIKKNEIFVINRDDTKQSAAHQGTIRSRIMNLINGVIKGFEKILIIQGTSGKRRIHRIWKSTTDCLQYRRVSKGGNFRRRGFKGETLVSDRH